MNYCCYSTITIIPLFKLSRCPVCRFQESKQSAALRLVAGDMRFNEFPSVCDSLPVKFILTVFII